MLASSKHVYKQHIGNLLACAYLVVVNDVVVEKVIKKDRSKVKRKSYITFLKKYIFVATVVSEATNFVKYLLPLCHKKKTLATQPMSQNWIAF